MTCQLFHKLFPKWTFGELGFAERGPVEEHLGSCPRCGQEWREYHEVIRLANHLRHTPLPGALCDSLQNLPSTKSWPEINLRN
jgi:hypothetical protein